MNTSELGRHLKLKVAASVTGATILLSGVGNVTGNISAENDNTGPQTQPSKYLVPVPCAQPMPWEFDGDQKQTGEVTIVLASVVVPKPAPETNKPECWKVVTDGETIADPSHS